MGSPFEMGFFSVMPIIFIIFFLLVVTLIIAGIIRSSLNYKKNASSPILEEYATVITKRNEVTGNSSMNNTSSFHNTRTHYYVTFETEAGQRMELTISGTEFGMLVEGDRGKLTYQGEWFKKFERDM